MHLNTHLDFDLVALETDDEITVMIDLEAPSRADEDSERPAHTTVDGPVTTTTSRSAVPYQSPSVTSSAASPRHVAPPPVRPDPARSVVAAVLDVPVGAGVRCAASAASTASTGSASTVATEASVARRRVRWRAFAVAGSGAAAAGCDRRARAVVRSMIWDMRGTSGVRRALVLTIEVPTSYRRDVVRRAKIG